MERLPQLLSLRGSVGAIVVLYVSCLVVGEDAYPSKATLHRPGCPSSCEETH